jgi:hypothetical protein
VVRRGALQQRNSETHSKSRSGASSRTKCEKSVTISNTDYRFVSKRAALRQDKICVDGVLYHRKKVLKSTSYPLPLALLLNHMQNLRERQISSV